MTNDKILAKKWSKKKKKMQVMAVQSWSQKHKVITGHEQVYTRKLGGWGKLYTRKLVNTEIVLKEERKKRKQI